VTQIEQQSAPASREPPSYSELAAPYWQAAAEERMVIQACGDCGAAIFPPRPLCPGCWSSAVEWRDASGLACVESFSVVHRAPNESFAAEVPYVVALVRLDEGPRMMTNIVGCAPGEVQIDMRVRAVFTDYGTFVLPQFEPDAS
jgi:uncharacterized protein